MSEEQQNYETLYQGEYSLYLPPIEVKGTPRSGRMDVKKLSAEEKQQRKKWSQAIRKAIDEFHQSDHPIGQYLPFTAECNLYITFFLSANGEEDTRYHNLDLDNLLKLALDALSKKIVIDDRLFKGIKVKKEIVHNSQEEKMLFYCITTKTLTINSVEKIAGDKFIDYWKSPVQYITATDENGKTGTFIDHLPGVFLRDEYENPAYYRDIVPGYDWTKEKEKSVSGCMVFKREPHLDKDAHEGKAPDKYKEKKSLLWLHKWD